MIDSEPGVRTKVAALAEVTKVGPGVDVAVFPDDPVEPLSGVKPLSDVVDGVVDGVVDELGVEVLVVLEDDGTDVLEDDGTDVLEDDGTDVLVVLDDDGTDVLDDDGTVVLVVVAPPPEPESLPEPAPAAIPEIEILKT